MAKVQKIDFYRPHKRVQEDGSVFNRFTGEYEYPPSRTKQAHLKECDINTILKQFSVTGQLTHISAKAALGAYQDLPDTVDFQDAQNLVIEAQKAFASLPAKTRERFQNDPAEFLAFMGDEANRDEAIKLGLVVPPPAKSEDPPPAAGEPEKGDPAQ